MVVNIKIVASTLGALIFFLGIALLLPAGVALIYGESAWLSFLVTAALSLALGAALWRGLRSSDDELRVREGFAIVALAWLVLSLLGALPFVFGGVLDTYTDAFFETMSGFTTTGATILGGAMTPTIEEIPNSFLFWRSFTQWLGGMGIIVLTLAILPILGVGGMQLYKAEVPGPSADKLTPRVRETAKRLWYIYVGITMVEIVLLLPQMSMFDAVNHAFATMATGGFSTENGSVGQYDSAYIDWVITVFMFLAGVNFALHYRMLRGKAITVFKDTELRVYTAIVVASTLLISVVTWAPAMSWAPFQLTADAAFQGYESFLDALRYGAFQATAIITTTGFGTSDYELWPPLAMSIMFILFFVGGMAGSTGGGIKVIRQILLFKNSFKEVKQLIHPHAVIPVRLNDKVVSQDVLKNVLSFTVLYFGLIFLGTFVMGALGLDVMSALSASMSCVGNIGPAFGTFGPAENYAHVPMAGKWVLSILMMAGRLEIFTVLILVVPAFWRR
jgi:trk system potassium uptake protein TrkH